MKLVVGLDVSLAKTAICVIGEHGKIIKEVEVESEPEAPARWLGDLNGSIAAIASEAGPVATSHIWFPKLKQTVRDFLTNSTLFLTDL